MRQTGIGIRLIVILVFGVTLNASAADTDLSGGAFLTHYVAGSTPETDPPEIGDADQVVSEIDTRELSIWYVLAAWDEPKTFCFAEFGFGDYDADIYTFTDWGVIVPPGDMPL
ncbi:hypothetical protein ACFL6M_06825, partial [Candidatus Eisenbacteria bacterium]